MAGEQVTTLTGLAVALVALSRFVATTNPTLSAYLQSSLASAEEAGISSADLALLRTVITAVSLKSETPQP